MHLNGPEVRRRAALLAPGPPPVRRRTRTGRGGRHQLQWLAQRVDVAVGTMHNATRTQNPQVVSATTAYAVVGALRLPNETHDQAAAALLLPEPVSAAAS